MYEYFKGNSHTFDEAGVFICHIDDFLRSDTLSVNLKRQRGALSDNNIFSEGLNPDVSGQRIINVQLFINIHQKSATFHR